PKGKAIAGAKKSPRLVQSFALTSPRQSSKNARSPINTATAKRNPPVPPSKAAARKTTRHRVIRHQCTTDVPARGYAPFIEPLPSSSIVKNHQFDGAYSSNLG